MSMRRPGWSAHRVQGTVERGSVRLDPSTVPVGVANRPRLARWSDHGLITGSPRPAKSASAGHDRQVVRRRGRGDGGIALGSRVGDVSPRRSARHRHIDRQGSGRRTRTFAPRLVRSCRAGPSEFGVPEREPGRQRLETDVGVVVAGHPEPSPRSARSACRRRYSTSAGRRVRRRA